MMFSADWFFSLESKIYDMELDSDAKSFDEIKRNLINKPHFDADNFAFQCIYVVLAGGFSQKTAKKIYEKIIDNINKNNDSVYDSLLMIFNNKNKINAICKIWKNRIKFCNDYYKCNDVDSRLLFLQKLPHIGKITANHLARNLGEDIVKYDIWIQRLGVKYSGNKLLYDKIDNSNLNPEIKFVCDKMFDCLVSVTGLPRGYIDVVLWRACQNGLIKDLL